MSTYQSPNPTSNNYPTGEFEQYAIDRLPSSRGGSTEMARNYEADDQSVQAVAERRQAELLNQSESAIERHDNQAPMSEEVAAHAAREMAHEAGLHRTPESHSAHDQQTSSEDIKYHDGNELIEVSRASNSVMTVRRRTLVELGYDTEYTLAG